MLSHLHIRDFAIVEQLELDLAAGMTALTGETGAGKSIVVDALGLALGDRADSSWVRHGAERAEISLTCDLGGRAEIRNWLVGQDLDTGEAECVIRRTIVRDGRSRGYINGSAVPLQSLRVLGDMLVDIHGQHEHQSLLRADIQRRLLDEFGQHAETLEQIGDCCRAWRDARAELEQLSGEGDAYEHRLELLQYQLNELEALGLGEGEFEELDIEQRRLANAGELLETGRGVLDALLDSEQGPAVGVLERCAEQLRGLAEVEARLAQLAETLETAAIQAQEAAKDLRHVLDSMDLDPQRLQQVEDRLASIYNLARKHRASPRELPEVMQRIADELQQLRSADSRREELGAALETLRGRYGELATSLGKARRRAAGKLAEKVTTMMQELGMPGGRFEVALRELDSPDPTSNGRERVEFLVSANPGQPPMPLTRIASGGELSRISLAIQVTGAGDLQVPTLIFDEVDVGIGGGVAEIVGRKLLQLAGRGQVICVTHLPQVAAQAQHHLRVTKMTDGAITHIRAEALGDAQRREEVARMLGGVEITEQTLAHAGEMLARAGESGGKKKGRKR